MLLVGSEMIQSLLHLPEYGDWKCLRLTQKGETMANGFYEAAGMGIVGERWCFRTHWLCMKKPRVLLRKLA